MISINLTSKLKNQCKRRRCQNHFTFTLLNFIWSIGAGNSEKKTKNFCLMRCDFIHTYIFSRVRSDCRWTIDLGFYWWRGVLNFNIEAIHMMIAPTVVAEKERKNTLKLLWLIVRRRRWTTVRKLKNKLLMLHLKSFYAREIHHRVTFQIKNFGLSA